MTGEVEQRGFRINREQLLDTVLENAAVHPVTWTRTGKQLAVEIDCSAIVSFEYRFDGMCVVHATKKGASVLVVVDPNDQRYPHVDPSPRLQPVDERRYCGPCPGHRVDTW